MTETMDSIDIRTLSPNQSPYCQDDVNLCKSNGENRLWAKTPFPMDEDLNSRVILYDGDIRVLSAEALVNPTNENLTQIAYASRLAGPELEKYIKRKIRSCATGDVRVTPGFASNYKNILHAVPPKYQPKYKTAAETALFHTYFKIMETLIERKIRTVIMPTLVTKKCDLPIEDNFHLQLRVIRRLLEKKRNEFDKIVIHMRPESTETMTAIYFQYFPRNNVDEELTCYRYTSSVGGVNGEPIVPGREIRIKSKPSLVDVNDFSIDLTSGLGLSTVVGKTPFSKMQDDLGRQCVLVSKPSKVHRPCSNQSVVRKKMFQGCTLL